MQDSPYRPHNPGHDYHGKGTYLITLVVSGRRPLLSSFSTDIGREDLIVQQPAPFGQPFPLAQPSQPSPFGQPFPLAQPSHPAPLASLAHPASLAQMQSARTAATSPLTGQQLLHLSPMGEFVKQAWEDIPALQLKHGNKVAVHACICMPDHFHGVIEIIEPMQWSLGDILQAFKAHCTHYWQQQMGLAPSSDRPISVDLDRPDIPDWLRQKALVHRSEGSFIRNLSPKQRQQYYALSGYERLHLFDDNYDDTICLDSRHREAMIRYVVDNPRRAILRRLLPDFMRRCHHLKVGNRSYGAFGNIFLLRWANKIQVQCHRKHPLTREPYETTAEYSRLWSQWIKAILGGQTVIVTPGISRGEQRIKNECLAKHYPLIHIQKEPIGHYWKPEHSRFESCSNGSLLILAPWHLDQMDGVSGVPSATDYSRFHNLNNLAAELCAFTGQATIVRHDDRT